MIRVLIADDHSIVRDGLKRILAATTDLEVAGEAASGDQALALVRANDYDIAMLDMSMPGLSGIDLIKRLKLEKPRLKILVLSMHGESQYAARALKAGASGYLTKDSAPGQLLGAIHKVAGGGVHISETAAAHLLGAGAPAGDAPHTSLSDREFEVLHYLAEREGRVVSRSELLREVWGYAEDVMSRTVDTHVAMLRRKLEADPAHPRHIVTVRTFGYRIER